MPLPTIANTGPAGRGCPAPTALSAGTLRKLWITSTNTLRLKRDQRGHDIDPAPTCRKVFAPYSATQAIASSHQRKNSRSGAMAAGFSDSSGRGSENPVALVRMVNSRNTPVSPRRSPWSRASFGHHDSGPATMAIRLMDHMEPS